MKTQKRIKIAKVSAPKEFFLGAVGKSDFSHCKPHTCGKNC